MPSLIPFLLITLMLFIVSVGIIMLVLVYQKRQLQYSKEKSQLKTAFEKEILESRLEIQEQTMKNISQELHDNIGQVLSLIKLTLYTMDCREPLQLEEKIQDSKQLLTKAIQDLRDLTKSLNSETVTQQGLIRSIQSEFELIRRTKKFETVLIEDGDQAELSQQHELILFRIFQEAINNIIKHSKATIITVRSCYHPGKYLLEITDNGKGFNLSAVDNPKTLGMGIRNIKNRSRIIGANFSLVSDVGKGTVLQIDLPV